MVAYPPDAQMAKTTRGSVQTLGAPISAGLPDSDVIDRHGGVGEALGYGAAAVAAYGQVEDHECAPAAGPRDTERPIGQVARINGQVDLAILRELDPPGIAVPRQAPGVPAAVDAARR